jgi:hypothetical protein
MKQSVTKNILLRGHICFLLIFYTNILYSQDKISYKRQISFYQCDICDCIKSRNYTIITNDLSTSRRKCAEKNDYAEIVANDLLQGGSSGGLFSGFNQPQNGCQNSCNHDFKFKKGRIENITIDNCNSVSAKKINQSNNDENTFKTEVNNNTPIESKFTGRGKLVLYDGLYEGDIVDDKPLGFGKFTPNKYNGVLEGYFKNNSIENWKYTIQDNGNIYTTESKFGGGFTGKANGKTVYVFEPQGNNSNYKETYFYKSGNKLIYTNSSSNNANNTIKYFENGAIISGNTYRFSNVPIQIYTLSFSPLDRIPDEEFINDKGEILFKDGLKIIGDFSNDKLKSSKVKIFYQNGDYYEGGVVELNGSYLMNGEGVLIVKGKKPKKGIWSYGEFERKLK